MGLVLLILLSCEHVQILRTHIDRAEVAHVLRLPNHVLRNAEDNPVGHHLVLLLVRLLQHHVV